MSYIPYSTLYKTFLFKSDSGKLYKYEIFQNPVEHKILTCISLLDENVQGTMNWVVSVPELILPVQGHHPEYADEEVRKHFNENYRQM